MVFIYTNELEVSEIVASLKKKRSGHGVISNVILKNCSPVFEKYMVRSFNDYRGT